MKPRINIYEQISSFYSFVYENPNKVNKSHVALYMFLLNQNNRSNWSEWFKLPYDLAMAGACIGSKATYYKCLNELQSWKLIKYKKGENDYKAPQISILVLSKSEPLTVPLSEPLTVPLTGQLSEQLSVLLTGKIDILITNNYKLITDNIKKWIKKELDSIGQSELVLDEVNLREQQFDWFWETYGKKVGKDIAKPKFMKLKDEDIVKILDHVPKYVASKPDRQFRKDPSTYINQKTWNDEIITETFTKPQITTQNGTLQERKYAHVYKAIRNLERLGSLNTEQIEVAKRYLEHATGNIDTTEFIGKLVKYDSRNAKSDFEDIRDSLRIGE
jgi:hypothetical protein